MRFTEEPLIIHWPEAMAMLKEAGHAVDTHTYIHFFKNAYIHPYIYIHACIYVQVNEGDDLSTSLEASLGKRNIIYAHIYIHTYIYTYIHTCDGNVLLHRRARRCQV